MIITLWMLRHVSFKLGAVSSLLTLTRPTKDLFVDYDTHETVTCNSHFIYDLDRQRSLQHFLQIEGLPSNFKEVELPSGNLFGPIINRLILKLLRHLRSMRHSSTSSEKTNAVFSAGWLEVLISRS